MIVCYGRKMKTTRGERSEWGLLTDAENWLFRHWVPGRELVIENQGRWRLCKSEAEFVTYEDGNFVTYGNSGNRITLCKGALRTIFTSTPATMGIRVRRKKK